MPFSSAIEQYTVLTVGDGLVNQVPALIVSTAAGIMVTYSAGGTRLGAAIVAQVSRQPSALWLAAAAMGTLAVVPGLPTIPFLVLSGLSALGARAASKREREIEHAAHVTSQAELAPVVAVDTTMQDLLQVDPVELEVGYGLIPLVDDRHGGDLLERIRLLRKQAATDLGILVPRIRIRDDVRLGASEYIVRLRGSEVARGEIMPRMLLALDAGGVGRTVDGIPTQDPSFGMPGVWVSPQQREEAETAGYMVVDPATVVSTHLMETLKSNAAELLGRQDVQSLLDTLKRTYPALVEEIVPARVSLGVLHRVLQRLLRERVPIRDLVTILEALADIAEQTKDPEIMAEQARRALGKAIVEQYTDATGTVRGIVLSPRLEAALMGFFSPRQGKGGVLPGPDQLTDLMRQLDALTRRHGTSGMPVVVVTPPTLRVGVRRLLEPVLPAVPVISLAELPPQVTLDTVAIWDWTDAAAA
jgi:flagellar biosynthesis protein FlhA